MLCFQIENFGFETSDKRNNCSNAFHLLLYESLTCHPLPFCQPTHNHSICLRGYSIFDDQKECCAHDDARCKVIGMYYNLILMTDRLSSTFRFDIYI